MTNGSLATVAKPFRLGDYLLPLFAITAYQTPDVEAGAPACRSCSGSGAEFSSDELDGPMDDCSRCSGGGVEPCACCGEPSETVLRRMALCPDCASGEAEVM